MRKVFAAVLIVGMAFVGMPVGALAATSSVRAKQTPLQNPPGTGGLQGVAKNAQQQNLPSVRVQVRAPNGQLAATGTTNSAGEFSFAGLTPGTYTVEIVNTAGEIVGTASVPVTAGATATVTLTATALGTISTTTGGAGLFGLGTLGTVAVVTAAAAAVIVTIVAVTNNASPSR